MPYKKKTVCVVNEPCAVCACKQEAVMCTAPPPLNPAISSCPVAPLQPPSPLQSCWCSAPQHHPVVQTESDSWGWGSMKACSCLPQVATVATPSPTQYLPAPRPLPTHTHLVRPSKAIKKIVHLLFEPILNVSLVFRVYYGTSSNLVAVYTFTIWSSVVTILDYWLW